MKSELFPLNVLRANLPSDSLDEAIATVNQ